MKVPTKAELYDQINALTRENIELQARLDAAEQERWQQNKDMAFDAFYNITPFNKGDVQWLTLEHIDKAGYWFTFYPLHDKEKQTFCVRHSDL